jgi:hypothetical protein
MHLNALFWEEVPRVHQTLKKIHGTKIIKNTWPILIDKRHGKPLGAHWDLHSKEQLHADS